MNKIERFPGMLRGHPIDRVPAGFWSHFDPAFKGGEPMARRHLEHYRATDMDVLKVMNDRKGPHRTAAGLAAIGADAYPTTQEEGRACFWKQLRSGPESVARGLQIIAEDLARFFRACVT